ncbi:MAG TPA: acyl-CoA dehydrogenase family protein, partial [Lautropia sp.]|nr:acyl-CoA dehydrogenase family protein [Lautropia sp.]
MILGQDLEMVRDAVRAYVVDNIEPQAAQWDRESRFPAEALKGLAALGCFGIAVPEQWEGAGLTYAALAVILEE